MTAGLATPLDVVRAWGEAFEARDLDAMMELFEPTAIWVSDEGAVVEGLAGIRGVFADFLALDAAYEVQPPSVSVADGIALVCGRWTVRGTAPDGSAVAMAGRTADILRRQGDGTWRYLIDSPFGGEGQPATEGSPA